MRTSGFLMILISLMLICLCSTGFSDSSPSLTDAKVKDMCAIGQSLYWRYINGGLDDAVSSERGFTEKGVFYYYIGTRKAFIAYFTKVFTGDSTLRFLQHELKRGFLKEHKGQLCHPGVGGGTIYTVSTGTVKLVKAKGLVREYLIRAPGAEANDWSERRVIFKFEDARAHAKNGWKINSSPEILGF